MRRQTMFTYAAIFVFFPVVFFKKNFLFIDFWERNIDLLFHLLVHSLVDSCICPDPGLNPQPLHMGDNALTNWATQPEPQTAVFLN